MENELSYNSRIKSAVDAILSVPQNKPEHAADHHAFAIAGILKLLVRTESAINNAELLEENERLKLESAVRLATIQEGNKIYAALTEENAKLKAELANEKVVSSKTALVYHDLTEDNKRLRELLEIIIDCQVSPTKTLANLNGAIHNAKMYLLHSDHPKS